MMLSTKKIKLFGTVFGAVREKSLAEIAWSKYFFGLINHMLTGHESHFMAKL
jgi:hypothetical protein